MVVCGAGSESWEEDHHFFILGTCGTQNCFPYDMKMNHTPLTHEKLAQFSFTIQGISLLWIFVQAVPCTTPGGDHSLHSLCERCPSGLSSA